MSLIKRNNTREEGGSVEGVGGVGGRQDDKGREEKRGGTVSNRY